MFPDQTKREKAEKRIQSATNRSLTRTNLSQKRPAASRKKQPKEKNELSTMKARLNELTTLMNVFSKSENKTRVAFAHVSLLLTPAAPALRYPLATVKSDDKNAKHSKISTNKTMIDI